MSRGLLRTVYIEPELDDQLRALAKDLKKPFNDVFNEILKIGMAHQELEDAEIRQKRRFIDELVADLLAQPRRHEVPSEHLAQLWHGVLKGLEPNSTGASLHVMEARYSVGDREYTVYWAIGSDSEIPDSIEFLTPSKVAS